MYPRCVTSHAKRAPVHRGRVKVQEEGKGVGKSGFIWAVADLRVMRREISPLTEVRTIGRQARLMSDGRHEG